MSKKILAFLLTAVMALSMISVASAENDTLTFISTEPNTLNMIQSNSNLDADVFYLTSAMLYRPYNGSKYAELAEGYTVSDDGLTYTYTIKDAKYTDGTPITAADFVYYMLKKLTAESATYYVNGSKYYNGECDASEVGIYAVDDKTFVVTLVEAITDFSPELQIYPLNQAFAEEKGDSLGGTPADMQYSGPYVLTEWVYGSYMTFEKNPDYIYAADSFQVPHLRMISNADANAKYSIFTSGEADLIVTVNSDLQQLIPDYCHFYLSSGIHGLEFNTKGMNFDGTTFVPRDPAVTAVLANANFRLALSYALNRELIVAAVNPTGSPTSRYIGEVVPGNTDDTRFVDDYPINAVPLQGDEAKAKEYMAAALEELGYASVKDLPTIKYLTFDSDMYRLMAETLQSEWKRVLGLECIEIELQPVQSAVMSMVFMNYDIYYQCLSCTPGALRGCMAFWITGGSVSDVMGAGAPFSSIYSNPEYDKRIEAAKYEFDRTARNTLLAEAEQIFVDDNIYMPIQYNGLYYAVSDRVEGYVMVSDQDGYMFNNVTLK